MPCSRPSAASAAASQRSIATWSSTVSQSSGSSCRPDSHLTRAFFSSFWGRGRPRGTAHCRTVACPATCRNFSTTAECGPTGMSACSAQSGMWYSRHRPTTKHS
eukprot:7635384-Pyramimonas_sp.AAC.1